MRAALLTLLTAATVAGAAVAATPRRPEGAPATCRTQSSAGFRESARNLVVGPLVLVGAREYSSPDVIAEFGGQKYQAVVLAGHRVTVELSRRVRRSTSLLYADVHWQLPDGERTVGDGHRVVEFRACAADRAGSSYNGRKATFWSGFVLTTVPRCLKLRIWVDDERTPRRAHIPLGNRCAIANQRPSATPPNSSAPAASDGTAWLAWLAGGIAFGVGGALVYKRSASVRRR